jgi:hypothetical protein
MKNISAFVPAPVVEQILVYRAFFDEDMLNQPRGIVVEEVTQDVDNLCDSLGEKWILLRKFFRECYQALEGPRLGKSKEGVICLISAPPPEIETETHLEGGYLKVGESIGGERFWRKLCVHLLEETLRVPILRYAEEPGALIWWHSGRGTSSEVGVNVLCRLHNGRVVEWKIVY